MQIVGKQVDVPVFSMKTQVNPIDITKTRFLADNIKGSSKYGMKLRLWEALQELAAERGWKIGAKSSFYRLCDAINEMFVD